MSEQDPNGYIYKHEIGPLSYRIKRDGKHFTLWLNGCRIGTPVGGEIHEFKTEAIADAKRELIVSAKRELWGRINARQAEIDNLQKALQTI